MLTLGEIIAKADKKYPNSHTTAEKVSMINEIQKKLFRTIYRVKTAMYMDILANVFLYPLDFHHSKIISVVVDGKHYDYADINNQEANTIPFLYTFQNSLGLYPTPTRGIKNGLFIHHYLEPKKLSASDLGAIPDFDPDFHAMLMYGLCIELAEDSNDVAMVNNFTSKYNGLLEEFLEAQPEPELPPIRVV